MRREMSCASCEGKRLRDSVCRQKSPLSAAACVQARLLELRRSARTVFELNKVAVYNVLRRVTLRCAHSITDGRLEKTAERNKIYTLYGSLDKIAYRS